MSKRGRIPSSCQLSKRRRCAIVDFDATVSAYSVNQLVKTARTDLESLFEMVKLPVPMSEKLQADYFDVIHHHLKEPVDLRRCESEQSLGWITASFYGITNLGCSYFERSAAHKQRFARCWPHVLKWLKAIFHAGGHFHGDEAFYYSFTFGVYNIASSVCDLEDVLEEDGAFEFAVTAWNGHVSRRGAEHFSVQPLLAYLSRGTFSISRIDHLMHNYESDPKRLVDKILTRLKSTTFHSPTKNVVPMTSLITMMRYLADMDDKSIRTAIFTLETGLLLVYVASSLVDHANRMEYLTALRSLFHVICGCIQMGHDCATKILEAGVLVPLLKFASFESSMDPGPPCSRPCDILKLLFKYLAFSETVFIYWNELHRLDNSCVSYKDLLKTSLKEFQDTWQVFEAVLIQQAVLMHFFSIDYSPQRGACASVSTACSKFIKCLRTLTTMNVL